VAARVPRELRDRLGIAVAKRTYRTYRDLLASTRWKRLAGAGARTQRLLWASTGTKDPEASDVLYVEALVAAETINTLPDATLLAFADHGTIREPLPADGGDADTVLARFERAGIDLTEQAQALQREGTEAFVASWKEVLGRIASKAEALEPAGARGTS